MTFIQIIDMPSSQCSTHSESSRAYLESEGQSVPHRREGFYVKNVGGGFMVKLLVSSLHI